jgi:predicted XRE-type DNA-binding protein
VNQAAGITLSTYAGTVPRWLSIRQTSDTYVLQSGDEGSIHIEQVLEYNEDPTYLAELLTYKLTLEAKQRIESSGLSRRQIAKRLSTSLPQLHRLLDPANSRKSMNQLVTLLHVLNCNVDVELLAKKVEALGELT